MPTLHNLIKVRYACKRSNPASGNVQAAYEQSPSPPRRRNLNGGNSVTPTKTKSKAVLLGWSKHVASSDVQDPLGVSLRGTARLGSQLLHCITSITPRARYYSFIPWCFFDFQGREKDKAHALAAREAVVLREKALTLACVTHHQHDKGGTCKGGAPVGTNEAKRWLHKGEAKADLTKLKFAESPALNAYFTSLVNLGLFVTEGDKPLDEGEGEAVEFTWDDIELSPLGLELAKHYDAAAGRLPAVRGLAAGHRRCAVKLLADLGKYGGLCELARPGAPDRSLLRDIFFGLVELEGASHPVRRRSLLLLLKLCRQFSPGQWVLKERTFADAVYFGELTTEDDHLNVRLPPALMDIATRWRMFYFHHYMSVALEGMFCWLVTNLATHGLAGASLEEFVAGLDGLAARKCLTDLLGLDVPRPFGSMTPAEFFVVCGVRGDDLGPDLGTAFEHAIPSLHPVAEDTLEGYIRDGEFMQSPTGLALPMILLAATLARFARWEPTNYGKWLAGAAIDPYLDLVPPVVSAGLNRRFDHWWLRPWRELTEFVLSRYVVRQHQAMSYAKSSSGDRCLLQTDGDKVFATGRFEKLSPPNPRLRSALQILKDLGLMEDGDDGVTRLTKEGRSFLAQELAKEAER